MSFSAEVDWLGPVSSELIGRYQVVLACVSLAVGSAVVLADRLARHRHVGRPAADAFSARLLGAAGVAGCVLGGWAHPGVGIWLVAAVLAAVPADGGETTHPLGTAVVPMTLASIAGLWLAVPDTEPAVAMSCVLIPVAVWENHKGVRPAPAGTVALAVMVSGVALVGAAGRPVVVAGLCSVVMIIAVPIMTGWHRITVRSHRLTLVGAHMVVVLSVPRLLMGRTWRVSLLVAALITSALLVVSASVRPERRAT